MEYAPQIICLTGHTGTGKSSIAQKLVRDSKFRLIHGAQLSRTHHTHEKIAEKLSQLEKDQIQNILIDGFPITKQDGTYFESHFHPITLIINLTSSDQTIITRKLSQDPKQTQESIRSHIDKHKNHYHDALYFYQMFGLVRHVNSDRYEDQVYDHVKKQINPKIVFLYGPPCTGKTIVANFLHARLAYHPVNLREFFESRKGQSHFNILHQLITNIKCSRSRRFVIDNMLHNQQQYKIFVEHLGEPYRIFEFDSPKEQVDKNIGHIQIVQARKNAQARYTQFIANRTALLSQFKNKPYYAKINSVVGMQRLFRQVIHFLKPTVLAANYTSKEEEEFLSEIQSQGGWKILDLEKLFNGNIERGTALGKRFENNKKMNIHIGEQDYMLNFIAPLWGSPTKKFLLTKLGDFSSVYRIFQNSFFFNIKLLVLQLSPRHHYIDQKHAIMYFFERGDVIEIEQKRVDLIDAALSNNVKYGIVFGPSASGKTTLSKLLSKTYNLILVQWEPTLAAIKQKLSEQEKALQEVPFPKILKYFKQQFAVHSKKTFLFDGFPNQKGLEQFIKELGAPSYFLNLKIDKTVLVKRSRVKAESDVNAQLGQQQSQRIDTLIQKGTSLQKTSQDIVVNNVKSKSYGIDVSGNIQNTLKLFEPIFSRRVYIVNEQIYDEQNINNQFNTLFKNIAFNNNLIFVSVSNLLTKYYHDTTSLSIQLQSQYKMRVNQKSPIYNSKNYNPTLVVQIINDYLNVTHQNQRDILIVNYPTHQPDYVFPRVSDEFSAIENGIGKVRLLAIIERKEIDPKINDPLLKLEKPVEVIKEKKEGEEGEEKPVEEQQNKKPKFNIYDYSWSNSNGRAKDLGQWYFASKTQIQQSKIVMETYRDHSLYEHFESYVSRIRSDPHSHIYIGVIRKF